MAEDSRGRTWPERLVAQLPDETILEISRLTDAEHQVLIEALQLLPPPIRSACATLLDSWDQLEGAERLAALVAFTEAMAWLNDHP